ncbi:MAG TPA: TetR/AcrR family transcriptional regulator [Gammaproteobacteria bacterium]|nr:TetR/AcrR family transcriptional regulator [Gammaproteobacteria bacterium]
MARNRQFDERQALVAAMLTFWEKGYEGTSIQDLEAAMGLGRTSIYNAFGNKRALFGRVMACYKDSVMAALIADMDAAPDIREGIRRLLNSALDIHFDAGNPGGCLVVLSVLESGQHDAQSRATMQQTLHDLAHALRLRLARARKAGDLSPDLDITATATTIATTMTGMMVMGQANFTRAALKKTINQVVGLLGQA